MRIFFIVILAGILSATSGLSNDLEALESLIVQTRAVSDVQEGREALDVLATTRDGPLEGFVISVTHSVGTAQLLEFAVAGDWTSTVQPDFFLAIGTVTHPGDPGRAGLLVVLDLDPTDGPTQSIPMSAAGEARVIARLIFRLEEPVLTHFPVRLVDGAARFSQEAPLVNSLVIAGNDYLEDSPTHPLELVSGGFVPESDSAIFLRGDTNADGQGDISDPITLLAYIFLGQGQILCPDAADTNDDGRMDISDAVFFLTTLFLGGQPPPSPGMRRCGPDLTRDRLEPCRYPRDRCPEGPGLAPVPFPFPIF